MQVEWPIAGKIVQTLGVISECMPIYNGRFNRSMDLEKARIGSLPFVDVVAMPYIIGSSGEIDFIMKITAFCMIFFVLKEKSRGTPA